MDIKSLVRFGKISSVDPTKATARVVFDDRDGLVSAELFVLQPSCMNNQFYSLPDVNDSVVCLMFPNDEHGGGVVLGSFFTEKNLPPAQNQDIGMIKFSDDSYIQFDRSKGELRVNCKGKIFINGEEIHLND